MRRDAPPPAEDALSAAAITGRLMAFNEDLRGRINGYLKQWAAQGRPTRAGFEAAARSVMEWRISAAVSGLWATPPRMVTATLDDGWGNGLQLIHLFAEAAGVLVIPLGLMQSAETIISACRSHAADILGITVLQFDSEDDIKKIAAAIPAATRFVAGGPVFAADPELAERAGIDRVSRDAGDFWEFLLTV